MDLYLILRRNGWRTLGELETAVERSTREGERAGDVRWTRSYVLEEADGGLGSVCLYEADSADAIRSHAAAAELPVTEIVKVADTVVVRPDPQATGES